MTDDRASPRPEEFARVDPYALARREAASAQIKRFFTEASVEQRQDGAYAVLLDGRAAKTPARTDMRLPGLAAAHLVAAEWNQQGDLIHPAEMPCTRLANIAIDGVAKAMPEVRAEVVKYAGSDLLCYRADGPPALVEQEAAEWDPVLDWARDHLQARFYLAEGLVFVEQPDHAVRAIDAAVGESIGQDRGAPFRLAALHVMTSLTGSALLGLAVLRGALTAADAWRKAHVDDDFQIARWGTDAEAAERRERRWTDMQAAARMLEAIG